MVESNPEQHINPAEEQALEFFIQRIGSLMSIQPVRRKLIIKEFRNTIEPQELHDQLEAHLDIQGLTVPKHLPGEKVMAELVELWLWFLELDTQEQEQLIQQATDTRQAEELKSKLRRTNADNR